jgi:hypothetical protein
MALKQAQLSEIDKLFTPYCRQCVPIAVQSKVRMGYRVEDNAVLLFEERPTYLPPHHWHEIPIAKFTYVGATRRWRLYCQHSDFRWHSYEALPSALRIEFLLKEVDDDPTGIFWG